MRRQCSLASEAAPRLLADRNNIDKENVVPGHLLDVTMFWSPHGGGVQRYLRTKRRWVARKTTWCHSIVVPGHDTNEVYGLPSLPLPGSGGYRLSWQRRACAQRIEALQPSVIEVGDPYRLAWSAADAGQRLGVPVIATCHSNVPLLARTVAGGWAQRTAARYLRHVYDEMDLVLAPSRWMVRQLHEHGIERVVHQPLGVDCNVFHPQRVDRRARERLGIATDARLLVYAGRFAPEKHLDLLVGTVEQLGPPYVLVVIGAGPCTPHASPRVRVLPYQRSEYLLAGLLAAADVFVHAGDQETFGLALLEAMACGTPVVARTAAGLAELLTPAASVGVRLPTATAFARAIRSLETRDIAAMRLAARRQALQYDVNRVFARLFARYAVISSAQAPLFHLAPQYAR
jgi:alpha-1,6-mannosyltransferase